MTFVKASREEQLRGALPVLIAARQSIIDNGDRDVVDSIQQAGGAGLACWWARQILQSVVPSVSLLAWQQDVTVRQSDITRCFDRAIRLCREPDARRGGWRVRGVERPARSDVPCDRQHLEWLPKSA